MAVTLGKSQQRLASHLNQTDSRAQAEAWTSYQFLPFLIMVLSGKAIFMNELARFDNILYRLWSQISIFKLRWNSSFRKCTFLIIYRFRLWSLQAFHSLSHTFIHFTYSFIGAFIECLLFSQPASNYFFERWLIWKAPKRNGELIGISKYSLNVWNLKVVGKGFRNRFIAPVISSAENLQGASWKLRARANATWEALHFLSQIHSICLGWASHWLCLLIHMEPLLALWFQLLCHTGPWQLTSQLPRWLRMEGFRLCVKVSID